MNPVLTIFLLAACEVCDALAGGGPAHPFAINPAWVPKCDPASARFIEADPWPAAGEVRRDRFTRDCAAIEMTRVFVPASDGFSGEELFVSASVERKRGRDVLKIPQHEFIGVVGAYSYRYSFSTQGGAQELRVSGSVETPRVSSHLVSTALAPGARKGVAAQSVTCEAWRRRCELVSRTVGGDVALPFFTVAFDTDHPDGNLCVGVPDGGAAVTITASGKAVVDGLTAAPGSADACLGDASRDALAAFGQAKILRYRVAAGDNAELDATGLAEALDLARFLLKHAILSDERAWAGRELAAVGDAKLDVQTVTN